MPTVQDLLSEIRKQVAEVTPTNLRQMLQDGESLVLLDVREQHEFREGHIPGATHLPRSLLELNVETTLAGHSCRIVAYCAGGSRSLLAADSLQRMGYADVVSLAGGFDRWRSQGHPVHKPRVLSADDITRYKRHLLIPEIGESGQLQLLDAKVLIVGAGGIGSSAAYYLAAAGVGQLGIVDFDVVDESNLQRQILHNTERVGQPKTASARQTLLGLNPNIDVKTFETRLSGDNVEQIFGGYDIVLDGSDNFPTRYLVSDACVKLGLANIHGSVHRFDGQVTVFYPPRGPCYRCLYPQPPPPNQVPSCAEAGVLGVLPGVIGLLGAVETIKLILDKGEALVGRLLRYDALRAEFRQLKLRRDPECAYCAGGKPFPGYVDYEFFCGNPRAA